jgi:putative GTP pyrophosphokinase
VNDEFEVTERSDKGEELIQEERFGYQSIHYLVRLTLSASVSPSMSGLDPLLPRSKSEPFSSPLGPRLSTTSSTSRREAIPREIRRRLMSLAGLLEIADREFQAIQDTDFHLTKQARALVDKGELGAVEITPDALKTFLDKNLGPDGRISDFSYDWLARTLKTLGFRTLSRSRSASQAIAAITSATSLGETDRARQRVSN